VTNPPNEAEPAVSDGGEGLEKRTFHAVKWAAVLNLLIQAGQFVLQFLLARILGPEVFGLGARLLAVGAILDRASEFGFNAALIQRDELEERHRSTAFYMNLALALTTGLLAVAAIHGYAAVAGWSPFLYVLQFAVFLPLVMALGHVQRSLLIRKLDFRLQTKAQGVAIVVYIVVAVGLALAGYGVWAIVAGFLTNYAVLAAVFWIGSDWRPRWVFQLKALWELLGFGVYIALSRAMFDLAKYLPVLLIGAVLGDVRAGLFSIGMKVGYVTVSQVVSVLNTVLFSSFSRMQKDLPRLRDAYLRSLRLMALTSLMPVIVAYAVVPILPPLMGDEWTEVLPVARILCFACIWWGLGAELMPPVLSGVGRPELRFAANLGTVLGLTVALLIGMQYDLLGACYATAVFFGFNNLFYQWLIGRTIQLPLIQIVARIWAPFVAFCMAAAAVHGVERIIPSGSVLLLLATAAASAIVAFLTYLAVVHVCDRRALREVLDALWKVVRSKVGR